MELLEFRQDLLESLRAKAMSGMSFMRGEFVDDAGARLADAEEIVDFASCRFEGTIKRQVQVDGYAYDEADNSLALLIADFSNDDNLGVLNRAEVDRRFTHLKNFIEAVDAGKFADGTVDESNPICGLANDIQGWGEKISRYKLYFVCDSEVKMKVKDWPPETVAGKTAEFHIWDIARFFAAFVSATGRDDVFVDFTETCDEGLPCLQAANASDDYQAYLCMIPGATLAGIYEQYGSRLLEGNVRSFLSTKGKVNSKIQQTIRTQPEMFFAFNNGIAATAEDIVVQATPSGTKLLSAKNLQIVNGGQTTASLAASARTTSTQKGADLSSVMVQMKLSVLPAEKAGLLIPEIARFANSQNKVSDADFFANHPFHIRIEDFSRRLFTPPVNGAQHGTHWFYERARGQYINAQSTLSPSQKKQFALQDPKSQLLTKTDVAKLINTWQRLPHKVSMGAQKNFLLFADSVSKEWSSNEAQFNEEYFKELTSLAILFRHVESLVSRQDWYQGGYRANIVTYSIAKLRDLISEGALGFQMNFKAIWDKQDVSKELSDQLSIICRKVFDVLTSQSRPKDNVTEWAKMEACWTQVKDLDIKLSASVLTQLQDLKSAVSKNKAAKESQKTDDGIATQISVISIPGAKWTSLKKWAEQKSLVSPSQLQLLTLAGKIPMKLPTDKQCSQLWDLRRHLLEEGFSDVD